MASGGVPDIYSKDDLPENWEVLTDSATGWPYFANHKEKITTWEDPRPGMSQYVCTYYYNNKKYINNSLIFTFVIQIILFHL